MAVCWAGLGQPRRQLLGEAERSGRTTKDVYLQGKEKLLKRYREEREDMTRSTFWKCHFVASLGPTEEGENEPADPSES